MSPKKSGPLEVPKAFDNESEIRKKSESYPIKKIDSQPAKV